MIALGGYLWGAYNYLRAIMLTKLRNSISNPSRPGRIVIALFVSWLLILGAGIVFNWTKASDAQDVVSIYYESMRRARSCAEETLREDCVLYTREMWIEVEQSDREKFNSWVDERDRYSGRQDTLVAMLVWITPPFAIVSLLVVWALGPSQKRSA